MLEQNFVQIYTKFKLHIYQEVFSRFQTQECSLTAVEAFCMGIIMVLNEPTVNEFASYVGISSPNAAYKVNSLVNKGHLEKIQSSNDRREYHLRPTQKFHNCFSFSSDYTREVMDRVRERFTPEEVDQLDRMLGIISRELMPEVELK